MPRVRRKANRTDARRAAGARFQVPFVDVEAVIHSLAADTALEFLEVRTLLSAAFDMTGLTALRADPTYSGINGSGVAVAVLDTGIYGEHPDLVNNVEVWFDAVKYGNQWATNKGDTNIADSFDPEGHGSHVAGTVASSNPAIGVATGAKIVDVRVLPASNEAQPSWDPLLTGLEWVLQNHTLYNIRVINMSLGDPSVNDNTLPASDDYSTVIHSLEAAGVTVVSAAGNGYTGYETLGESSPAIWSTLAAANVWQNSDPGAQLPIECIDPNGNWVSVETAPAPDNIEAGSQRSTLSNMVAAPGSEIYSTWNGANGLMYNTIMGTSQASPLVAGMVALMQDAAYSFGGRYLSPTEIQQIARSTADHIVDSQNPNTERFPVATNGSGQLVQTGPVQDLTESGLTYDRVNIYRAVQAVRALVTQSSLPSGSSNDTNNTEASATSLADLNATTSDTAQGTIGTDGAVAVGANDVDLYKVALTSPGQITLALAPISGGTTFSPVIRLFDSTGVELAVQTGSPSAYPTLTSASTLAAGTYYIGISSQANTLYNIVDGSGAAAGGSTGDYQLTASLSNPDPNGIVTGAVPVDLTQPDILDPDLNVPANYFLGAIGSDPNPVDPTLPRIQIGATDVDMFKVVAPDTGVLTANIHSQDTYGASGIDSFLLVYDQSYHRISYNDDKSQYNTDSYLQVNVTAGQTYYVAVCTYGTAVNAQGSVALDPTTPYGRHSTTGETGNYDLYLSFNNGDTNGTVFSAVDFQQQAVNNAVSGVIGSDSGHRLLSYATNGGNKDVDFYSYSPTQDGLLEIAATSPDHSMMPSVTLWQYDATAQTVNKVGDATSATAALDYPVTAGQTYYVSVTGAGNQGFNWFAVASGSGGQTGNYQLRIVDGPASDAQAINNNSIQNGTPTPLTLDQPVLGNIGMDGPLIVGPTDVDMYSYTPALDQTVTILADASRSGSADTFVRLFDGSGNELAYNDNMSASSSSSQITYALQAGQTYYIGVNGASAHARDYNPLTGAGAAAGSTGAYTLLISAAGGSQNDTTPPTSSVDALPAYSTASFTVHWTGNDNPGGSGLANYDVYVSDNGGAYTLWQDHATATIAAYSGQDGHTYAFYSVARDVAGNLESAPASAQATTLVDAVAPTSHVLPITANLLDAQVSISWTGSDNAGGSGIASYDIYVSVNGGPYTAWLMGTTQTSGTYTPSAPSGTFDFYSRAHDVAGNIEAAPSAAQATVTLQRFDHTLTRSAPRWTFHDADGTAVTVTLAGPGNIDLVRGVDAAAAGNLLEVIAGQTTAASSIIITTAGGATAGTTLGSLDVTGSLGGLVAATTDLTGSATINAALGRMTLRDVVSGSTISIGLTPGSTPAALIDSTKPVLTFGQVQDLTLDSASPILSLRCIDWLDSTGAAADSITAPALTTLVVTGHPAVAATSTAAIAGDFQADLVLSDAIPSALPTIGKAVIAGNVADSNWDIDGRIGTVMVMGNTNGWTLHSASDQLAGVAYISAASMSNSDLTVNGTLSRLSAANVTSGSISANTLGTLTTRGDFGADVMLAGASGLPAGVTVNSLGAAILGGRLTGGAWSITGPAGKISAKSAAAWSAQLLGSSGTLAALLLTDRTATSSPTISATAIRTASVLGSLSNADITLSQGVDPRKQALGLLRVGGAFDNSQVNSSGNIGVISLRTMTSSRIFAGVNASAVPAGLPTAAGQFDASSISQLPTIASVQILGPVPVRGVTAAPSLVNSSIAAGKITAVTLLGAIADQDDAGGNNPTPFGFATWQAITSYRGPAASGDFMIEVV